MIWYIISVVVLSPFIALVRGVGGFLVFANSFLSNTQIETKAPDESLLFPGQMRH